MKTHELSLKDIAIITEGVGLMRTRLAGERLREADRLYRTLLRTNGITLQVDYDTVTGTHSRCQTGAR